MAKTPHRAHPRRNPRRGFRVLQTPATLLTTRNCPSTSNPAVSGPKPCFSGRAQLPTTYYTQPHRQFDRIAVAIIDQGIPHTDHASAQVNVVNDARRGR